LVNKNPAPEPEYETTIGSIRGFADIRLANRQTTARHSKTDRLSMRCDKQEKTPRRAFFLDGTTCFETSVYRRDASAIGHTPCFRLAGTRFTSRVPAKPACSREIVPS
jgi:hypothetical protein